MADIIETIREVCQDTFGDTLRDIKTQLSTIRVSASPRRFLVNRMGSTGSTWVAKLLNSHPEVFCSHEGILAKVFPSSELNSDQIITFIQFLAANTTHGAYSAFGDIGSSWLGHVISLPVDTFTTAMLLRHPAKMLNTRLEVIGKDPASIPGVNKGFMLCIEKIWGIKSSTLNIIDQIFLQDAFVFASQVQGLNKVDLIMLIENMNDLDYCQSAAFRLTGLMYEASALERFLNHPLNRRSANRSVKEILRGFSEQQRRWYQLMLKEVLPHFGYALEDDACLQTDLAMPQ